MWLIKRRVLFFFALSFGAGVTAAYALDLPAKPLLIAAAVVAVLSGICVAFQSRRRFFAGVAAALFFCATFLGGGAYLSARLNARPRFETSYGATFSGKISGQPYVDQDGGRFVSEIENLTINGAEFGYPLRLYLRGDQDAIQSIGCGMSISGVGHVFMNDDSTNPHEYDFGKYLWREGQAGYVTAYLENAELSGERGGAADFIYKLRSAVGKRIDMAFGENADVVRALVIGDRRDMDDDIRDAFSEAGVAHLLSISGLHITMIAMAISYLFMPLFGVRISSLAALVCVLLYGAVIGFVPSVTRAAVMYAIMSFAPIAGRLSDGTTRISAAFLLVLIINPLDIGDPGFALSFMASLGIIWLNEPLCRLLCTGKIDGKGIFSRAARYLAQTGAVTLAAQLATYPAVALFYGSVPVLSLISNIVIAPFTMISLVAAYVGTAIPALAFIPSAMITALKWMVRLCADVSWASFEVASPPIWLWLGFLAIGLAVCDMSPLSAKIRSWLLLAMPVMAVAAYIITIDVGMKFIFLDVDQADSTIIENGGRAYIIDLGLNGGEAADYIRGEELDVEAIFLSHPHYDHAGGLGEFIEEYPVETIYVPEGWFEAIESDSIREECDAARSAGSSFVELSKGDRLDISEDFSITILEASENSGDAVNDMSLVMYVQYGKGGALFMGDAKALNAPDVDVLKVGHHGSNTATDQKLVDETTPELAVISCGKNNSYGHPHASVLELLEACGTDIYRTDEDGAVTVIMNKNGGLKARTFN